jgi:hypothetical protein
MACFVILLSMEIVISVNYSIAIGKDSYYTHLQRAREY